MLRGIHSAAAGMYAAQRKTEMLTNNIANVQTAGYKADQASNRAFPEMLLERVESADGLIKGRNSSRVGTLPTGVYLQELTPRFIQGDLRETGHSADLALTDKTEGTAFFTVENNGQIFYTRNGNFTINGNGFLTAAGGYPVLDVNGNTIVLSNDQFVVNENGVVTENGIEIAKLGIAITENPETLAKEGDSLYRLENNATLPNAADQDYTISQGYVEASTVDLTRTMADMMTAYRAFEANQKVLQAYDRSMDKAVNEIGRVNG